MTTARDIIKASLRHIAVLGTGSSLDPNDADDALKLLNAMVASWSAEGNMIYTQTKETFPLTTAASYTIGSGGDFDTERPIDIKSAYVTQGSTDYTLLEYNNAQYSGLANKSTTGGIPDVYYYDGAFPLATVSLYPSPSGVTTITMNTTKPLTEFTTLDTAFNLPAEYLMALEFNLAVLVAPQYEREASMTVKQFANTSKKTVESQINKREYPKATIDVPDRNNGTFNIYSGTNY